MLNMQIYSCKYSTTRFILPPRNGHIIAREGEVLQAHTERSTARLPIPASCIRDKTGIWPKITNVVIVETQRDTY